MIVSRPKVIETANNCSYTIAGMGIGENVKRLRVGLGLSQEQLSKRVGISQVAIKKIEAGTTVRSKYLPKIANVLGVPLSAIDPDDGDLRSEDVSAILDPPPLPSKRVNR